MRTQRLIVLFSLIPALFLSPKADTASQDSVLYAQKRTELLGADSANFHMYVAAADELAEMKMYRDAVSILQGLVTTEFPVTPSPAPIDTLSRATGERGAAVGGRISLGVDFYSYGDSIDVDTADTREERHTAAHLHTELTIVPRATPQLRLSPELVLSSRTSHARIASSLALLDNKLRIEAYVTAEKPFWSDYAGKPGFVALKSDSSDMLGAGGGVVLLRARNGSSPAFSMPLRAATERYRANRYRYESNISVEALPRMEYTSSDFSRTFSLRCDVRYTNYSQLRSRYRESGLITVTDTSDKFSLRPELDFSYWTDDATAEAQVSYTMDLYANAHLPRIRQRPSTHISLSCRPGPWITTQITAEHEYEATINDDTISWTEYYGDIPYIVRDTALTTYTLHGNRLTATPEIRFHFAAHAAIPVSCVFELRSFPIISRSMGHTIHPMYIEESMRALEPKVGLNISPSVLDLTLSVSYRREDVGSNPSYARKDKEILRLAGDASLNFSKRHSAFCFFDWDYRWPDRSRNTTLLVGSSFGF